MKVHKILSLDMEVVEKLAGEENASKLVNDMLIKHYKAKEPTTLAEKKKRLALMKLEADYKKKAEALA